MRNDRRLYTRTHRSRTLNNSNRNFEHFCFLYSLALVVSRSTLSTRQRCHSVAGRLVAADDTCAAKSVKAFGPRSSTLRPTCTEDYGKVAEIHAMQLGNPHPQRKVLQPHHVSRARLAVISYAAPRATEGESSNFGAGCFLHCARCVWCYVRHRTGMQNGEKREM